MKQCVPFAFVLLLLFSCKEKSEKPVVSTNIVTEITTISAVSGGVISDDGGEPVILKGICWNTATDPTTDNHKTTATAELNSFSGNLTDLSPKTKYYVRAYATNSVGTSYGESVSFTTLGDSPAPVTGAATAIDTIKATLNGSVNPNELSTTVIFEWGITSAYGNTITSDNNILSGHSSVNVSATLTGLIPGTIYHFRVKAENSIGSNTGYDMTFTTLGDKPAVTTKAASDTTLNSIKLKGSVNPNYLSSAVAFEWGTTTSYGNTLPAVPVRYTGSTVAEISTNLTGLDPGTVYHYRIVSTNSLGTSYGNDIIFKTLGDLPAVRLSGVSEITLNTASLTASVNPNYLSTTVLFEWGATNTYNNITAAVNIGDGNSITEVSESISGLVPGTTYHFRVKATNLLGTVYSEDLTFTTFALIDADNNYYNSVNIGTQTWMRENLKTTRLNDNTEIQIITDNTAWSNMATPAYCWYDNNGAKYKNSYGALYNWFAVETDKLCPDGWHVPDNTEWATLINYLGGTTIAGGKLKETSQTNWETPNTAATNESGFTGLPGGNRDLLGPFYNIGQRGYWWTKIAASSTNAWYMHMAYNTTDAILIDYGKTMGFSVRCIKD